MRKRTAHASKWGLAALLTGTLLVSAACSGGGEKTAALANPDNFKINGDYVVPPTAHGNPFIAGYVGGGLEPYLQDSLFAFTPYGDVHFKPHLATDYTIDDSVVTVKLREGITWDDGDPITTEDVVTSYLMWAGKKQVWEYLESVRALDESTLEFDFNVSSDLMMNLLRDVPIAAKTADYGEWASQYEQVLAEGRTWNEETGTFWFTEEANEQLREINESLDTYKPDAHKTPKSGPFTLDTLTTGEAVLLENEDFYNDTGIGKLSIIRVTTPELAANAMVDGTLDMASGGMTEDLLERVRKRVDGFEQFFLPEYSQMSVVFNVTKPFAEDLAFRQAMGYLLNDEMMLSLAEVGSLPSESGSTGLPLSLQETYGLTEYADSLGGRKFDPDKAKEILEDAGYTQGANGSWTSPSGQAVAFTFACNNGWASALLPGEAYVNDLKEFGFDVTFRPMESAAYDAYLRAGEHTVAIEFAPPSNIIYASPYGTYEQLYRGRAWLFGLAADDQGQLFLPDSTTGQDVDVVSLTKALFTATGDEATDITKQLMAVSNDNQLFLPYLEKGFPVRVLRTNIDLGVYDGSLVQDPRFSGVAETMFATLISEGTLSAAIE